MIHTKLKRGSSTLKKSGGLKKRSKPKTQEEKELNLEELHRMWRLFLEIWEERKSGDGKNYSEISKTGLGGEARSTFFHHIYEKSLYPKYKYDKDNIIMITFAEHSQLHIDESYYEEVNKRRKILKIKYETKD